MKLKVMIADDEEAMRMILKKSINKLEGFEVIGEAENGEEALNIFERFNPDIVFMDVEMPSLSGIDCAKKIFDINPKTFIIFATAHDQYMPEAFDMYAFDYIVKPFKLERVYKTLQRIKDMSDQSRENAEMKALKPEKGLGKLMIKSKEGMSFVDFRDITVIQRENRSTAVYTLHESYITSEGLTELEEKLDKGLFFRCHKSYIINLSMIDKIFPYGRWTYIIKLKNTDKDALITHEKYEELKKMFGF